MIKMIKILHNNLVMYVMNNIKIGIINNIKNLIIMIKNVYKILLIDFKQINNIQKKYKIQMI